MAYNIPAVRPSKDIDFLGAKTSNDADEIRSAIHAVADIELSDGVIFNSDDIEVEQITEDAEYGGFRIKISASVGGDFHRLQLDIGFGDEIVAGPVDMDYPALLDFPSPNIKVYSLESAIAEKFEAIVSLGLIGSRMKDYFDVWFLIENHEIRSGRLKEAIEKTFSRRNTPIEDCQYIFDEEFKMDKSKTQQWQAFLNRSSIELDVSFDELVSDIERYIFPIVNLLHFGGHPVKP